MINGPKGLISTMDMKVLGSLQVLRARPPTEQGPDQFLR